MGIRRQVLIAMCATGLFALAVTGLEAKERSFVRPPSERDARAFFGQRRQPIYFDDTLARQFALGISGGVEEERTLADGSRLIATCRPHNCEDKAAAVIGRDGRIVAVGMIGFRCRKRGDGVPPCDEEPSAFVFVKRGTLDKAKNELRAWATGRRVGAIEEARPLDVSRRVIVTVLD